MGTRSTLGGGSSDAWHRISAACSGSQAPKGRRHPRRSPARSPSGACRRPRGCRPPWRAHQLRGLRGTDDPLLRERHDLDIAQISMLSCRQLDAEQARSPPPMFGAVRVGQRRHPTLSRCRCGCTKAGLAIRGPASSSCVASMARSGPRSRIRSPATATSTVPSIPSTRHRRSTYPFDRRGDVTAAHRSAILLPSNCHSTKPRNSIGTSVSGRTSARRYGRQPCRLQQPWLARAPARQDIQEQAEVVGVEGQGPKTLRSASVVPPPTWSR